MLLCCNGISGKNFSITSKSGLKILKKYIYQLGGHNGPCAISSKGRCAKSSKADGKCEVSPKGRCRKLKSGKTKTVGASATKVTNKSKNKVNFYKQSSEYWRGTYGKDYTAISIYENIDDTSICLS